MAAISWPTGLVVVPTDFTPGIQEIGEVVQVNRHGFEHIIPGVQLRTASMSFDIRDELTSHRIMGLVENLEGARGTVKVPWFNYTTQIGLGTGSPTVSGAVNAGSSTIPTTGWTGSNPKLGQDAMVSFGNPPFVYRVLSEVTGASPTLTVRPRPRIDVDAGSAITYAPDPENGVWLLTTMRLRNSSDVYGAMIAPKLVQGIVLEFIESIRGAY